MGDSIKVWSSQNTTLACWNRHSSNVGTEYFFSHEKVCIHDTRLFFFLLFYAHLIRDVTVGDLDLIYVICKEKNIMNVSHIRKIVL